MKNKY